MLQNIKFCQQQELQKITAMTAKPLTYYPSLSNDLYTMFICFLDAHNCYWNYLIDTDKSFQVL